jgi:hypothetical protein
MTNIAFLQDMYACSALKERALNALTSLVGRGHVQHLPQSWAHADVYNASGGLTSSDPVPCTQQTEFSCVCELSSSRL